MGTLILTANFQDASAQGPVRRFSLIGSADCVVAFEAANATNASSGVRILDEHTSGQKGQHDPAEQLILKGPSSRSVTITDPATALRYVVLQGTVTSCWVDCGAQPATGPQGPGKMNPTGTKTGAYTASGYDLVVCDPTGGAFAVTLPAAASVPAGTPIHVKNKTTSTTAITIDPSGSDTVDGGASATMNTSKAVTRWISDGVSNWFAD